MKKIMSLFMLMPFFLLVACQANQATKENDTPLQDVTLLLDWTPNTNHTGIYVAQEKGYFKEQGLNVTILQPSEDGAEIAVASKQATFGISFQDTLAASFSKKLPIQAIGAVVAHNTSGILSLSDKHIQHAKDLEHKTYATWQLPIEQAMMKTIMEESGGDFSKLQLIPSTVTDIVSALQTSIDTVWVFEGWDVIAAKQKGLSVHFMSFKELNDVFDYYTPVIIAHKEVDRTVAKKMMQALKKAYTFSSENSDEAATILLKAAPELDEELVKESQRYLSKQYIEIGKEWGYIDKERWQRFYQWVNDKKLVDQPLEPTEGFTNEFIDN